MNYIIWIADIVLLFVLARWLFKKYFSDLGIWYWLGLAAKLLMSIGVGIYYTQGDSFTFFKDSVVLTNHAYEDLASYFNILFFDDFGTSNLQAQLYYWVLPRAFLFDKIISILNFFTASNYWMNGALLSSFSFFAACTLVRKFKTHMPEYYRVALLVLLFVPTVMFNSSGVIKETVVCGLLFFMFGSIIEFSDRKRMSLVSVLALLVFGFFLFRLKYYYLIVFMPVFGAYMFVDLFNVNKLVKVIVYFSIFALGVYGSAHLHYFMYPDRLLTEIVKNHDRMIEISAAGKFITYNDLQATMPSALMNIPKAIAYGLSGPFVWEAKNMAMVYVGVENILILITILFTLYALFKGKWRPTFFEYAVLLYIIILAIILPLSTPNFGTLMRYKVSYMPLFMILILHNSGLFKKLSSRL